MKISLNWLKKYVNIPETVSDEELIRLIGARLVEVEGVVDETHKYDKIVVVKVESCEKIPETHLSLCQINNGGEELVQVACGAPNVYAGMLAAWIAPGAVVPASVHEDAPFVIGKRKLRGYESSGMLAGADELDFGDDHSGIVEIDPAMAKPGDLLADVFDLNDLILEIENKSLTHRPDTFGIIGFAREVAGILGLEFDYKALENSQAILLGSRPVSPSPWVTGANPRAAALRNPLEEQLASFSDRELKTSFSDQGLKNSLSRGGFLAPVFTGLGPSSSAAASGSPRKTILEPLDILNIFKVSVDEKVCPRYTAVVLEKHGEIEKKYLTWVDTMLCKAGMRPVDPIVDATNFVMLLTGQPLHAFDYDKFAQVCGGEPEIVVRRARVGEKIVLLDEKEVELNENDIVICAGEKPVVLAGAMGGKATAIDENTRKIILESATFSLYNLRKTQMAHGIFSEAITRFTKGQPAAGTLVVAEACAEMLSRGFKVVGVTDTYPQPQEPIVVKITTDEINGLLGTEYTPELIVKTLANVGFEIETENGAEDEAKSGAKTGGVAKIEAKAGSAAKIEAETSKKAANKNLTIKSPDWRTDIHIKEDIIEEVGRLLGYDNIEPTLPKHRTAEKNELFGLKKQIRESLARFGANEVLTYSFVSGKLLEKVGQDAGQSYKIVNSISPELQYVRQSMVPSLLEKTYLNEKLPVEKFAIFEMNQVFSKRWGMNDEGVPAGRNKLGFVIAERKNAGTAYYAAKKYVAELLKEFNVEPEFAPLEKAKKAEKLAESAPFEPKRSAEILVDGEYLGVVGEFKNSVRHEFKLTPYLAGFEIDLDMLMAKKSHEKKLDFRKLKHEDVTIETDKIYAEVLAELKVKYPEAKITPGVIYQAEGQTTKKMTFHLVY